MHKYDLISADRITLPLVVTWLCRASATESKTMLRYIKPEFWKI